MAPSNANSLPLGGSSSSDEAMARARAEYDRRNRSLPHRKYGPYTCPRCTGMFWNSPQFAAHMKSHYKLETAEEKRARLEEKQRRRGKRQGPRRAVAGPWVVAFRPVPLNLVVLPTLANAVMTFQPVQLSQVTVQTQANASMAFEPDQLSQATVQGGQANAPTSVITENVEAQEVKMEVEKEEVHGVGSAPPGFQKIKEEPAV